MSHLSSQQLEDILLLHKHSGGDFTQRVQPDWELVRRFSLPVAATTISLLDIPARTFLRVLFHHGKAKKINPIKATPMFVDGRVIRDVDTMVLKERSLLSETGVITVIVARHKREKTILGGPHFFSKGVIDREQALLMNRAESSLRQWLSSHSLHQANLEEEIRLYVRRFFNREAQYIPCLFSSIAARKKSSTSFGCL